MKKATIIKKLIPAFVCGAALAFASPAFAEEEEDGGEEYTVVQPKPVPDGGTTVLLLGAGLAGIAAARKFRK